MNDLEKKAINSRLNRLVGQLQGVRRMIDNNRSTEEVTQQILAAREALSKVGLLVIKDELVNKKSTPERTKKLIEKIFRI